MYLLLLSQEVADRPLMVLTGLTPMWAAFTSLWTGFFLSNSFLIVTLFWGADLFLGSLKALLDRNFKPQKFVKGVARWLLWIVALLVAWGFRIGLPGVGNIIASIVESVIILAEGSSILRNLAMFSSEVRVQKLLSLFADKIDDKIDDMTDKISELEEEVAEVKEEVHEVKVTQEGL